MTTTCNSAAVVTAIVLTYNEELNIGACLESIREFENVFVVDSGSTDRTLEICRSAGIEPVRHPYVNHASQWLWALENLPIATPWVLALDADFVVTPELASRILVELPTLSESVAGVYIRHLYRFGWGDIRFGGTKHSWLRIVRHGRAKPDAGDLVDFRFVVDGDVITWSEAVREYNRNDDDISVWIAKQDKFALRLAVEEELRRRGLHKWSGTARFFGSVDERITWLRDRWLQLPLLLRPTIYFTYRYFLALGFLDGRAGFLYHFLQGFWLRLIVDWKVFELRALDLDNVRLREFADAMLTTRSGSVQKISAQLDASTSVQASSNLTVDTGTA